MSDEWVEKLSTITAGFVSEAGPAAMASQGEAIVSELESVRGVSFAGARVLDIGCGNGRLAIPFTTRAITSYLGFDVVRDSIRFCREAFDDYPGFRFEHADVRNARYAPGGALDACDYRFPAADGSIDLALAFSVFTHLESQAARDHFLAEARRVLHRSGAFWATFFLAPPNVETPAGETARVVVDRQEIGLAIRQAGFKCTEMRHGETTAHHDQTWMRLVCQPS